MASLVSPQSGITSLPCLVSGSYSAPAFVLCSSVVTHHALFTAGYPVLRNKVEFKRPGFAAIKDEWTRFMMAAKVREVPSDVALLVSHCSSCLSTGLTYPVCPCRLLRSARTCCISLPSGLGPLPTLPSPSSDKNQCIVPVVFAARLPHDAMHWVRHVVTIGPCTAGAGEGSPGARQQCADQRFV